ncbi:unnamed protein product [Phytomonas sp. EM1]|nr:unnamed protein product [Phytomonas sp. EM1]|eukprot:CCW61260.1 unnamed protein product [Phytomonas sp. isolate EM1]
MLVETSNLSEEVRLFAISLMLLMAHPTFKSSLWRFMTHEERLRLYAFHQQARYGDAPQKYDSSLESWLRTGIYFPVMQTNQTQAIRESLEKSPAPQPEVSSASRSSSFLSWLNVSARLRYRRWASLRGRMTQAVAVEAFCAEVLALMVRHKAFPLVPLVEAALIRANYEAISVSQQTRANDSSVGGKNFSFRHLYTKATQRLVPRTSGTPSSGLLPPILFCVHALEQDPAAMAMMWLCRAHGISYEFMLEPFSKPSTWSIKGFLSGFLARQTGASDLCHTKIMLDDYKDADNLPFCCGIRFGAHFFPVFTPEAGFQLLFDVFLCNMPHWGKLFVMDTPLLASGKGDSPHVGRASTTRPTASSAANDLSSHTPNPATCYPFLSTSQANMQALTQKAAERCVWMDMLKHITTHLRGPIMKLIMDPSAQAFVQGSVPDRFSCTTHLARESSAERETNTSWTYAAAIPSLSAGKPSRKELLRTTSKHFHRFERLFLQSVVTQHEQETGAVPEAVLSDARAAINVVLRYFKSSSKRLRRLVSITDAYTACCAYLLCTSTFTQDVFPTFPPPSLTMKSMDTMDPLSYRSSMTGTQQVARTAPSRVTLGLSCSSISSERDPNLIARIPSAPTEVRVCLPGVSSSCNDLLNRVVHAEEKAAQHRLLSAHALCLTSIGTNQDGGEVDIDAGITFPQRGKFPGILSYHMTRVSATAAEGIESLIFTRLRSCHSAELDPSDPTNKALSPFIVFAHILSQSWRISQEQCVGFPYLMLDPKRRIPLMMEFIEQQASSDRGIREQRVGAEPAPAPHKGLETQPPVPGSERRFSTPVNNIVGEPNSGWGATLQNAWRMLTQISTDNNSTEDGGTPSTECNPIYGNRSMMDSKI